jgi:zinc protease
MTRLSAALSFFLLLIFSAPAQAALFDAKSTTLANGMQVVVVENHRAPIVAHMLWIKAGSGDDPYGKSGLAHYLEHLMFKGTKKFPQGEYSKRIARLGGSENAFTSYDYTAYHATVAAQNLPLVMELEADRLANLIITPEGATPELQVILDERRQRMDGNPYSPFSTRLEALLHPRHPYGIPVIGWREEMETFTVDDAVNFYKRWYHPANVVLVVSGDVKPDDVFALANRFYGSIPAGEKITRTRLKNPQLSGDIAFQTEAAGIQEKLTTIAVRAPSYRTDAPLAYALDLLQEILDGSDAAYLGRTLVQEKKLASRVDISYDTATYDETSFSITLIPQGATTPDALIKGLQEALKDADKALTPEEIARAKQSLQRGAILARDSVLNPGYTIGGGICTGRSLEEIEAWPERIAAVTPEQLKKALDFLRSSVHVSGSVSPKMRAPGEPEAPVMTMPSGGGAIR